MQKLIFICLLYLPINYGFAQENGIAVNFYVLHEEHSIPDAKIGIWFEGYQIWQGKTDANGKNTAKLDLSPFGNLPVNITVRKEGYKTDTLFQRKLQNLDFITINLKKSKSKESTNVSKLTIPEESHRQDSVQVPFAESQPKPTLAPKPNALVVPEEKKNDNNQPPSSKDELKLIKAQEKKLKAELEKEKQAEKIRQKQMKDEEKRLERTKKEEKEKNKALEKQQAIEREKLKYQLKIDKLNEEKINWKSRETEAIELENEIAKLKRKDRNPEKIHRKEHELKALRLKIKTEMEKIDAQITKYQTKMKRVH